MSEERRPPNPALTLETLMQLDGVSDPVWYVINGWTDHGQVIGAGSAQNSADFWLKSDMLLFARKPTEADITAARSARNPMIVVNFAK